MWPESPRQIQAALPRAALAVLSQELAGSQGAGMGRTEAPQDRGHLPVPTSRLPVGRFGGS